MKDIRKGPLKVVRREPSARMCAELSFGPWQFSHWMFAKRAVLGNCVRIFDQFSGSPCDMKLEARKPAKSDASSMPLFFTAVAL